MNLFNAHIYILVQSARAYSLHTRCTTHCSVRFLLIQMCVSESLFLPRSRDDVYIYDLALLVCVLRTRTFFKCFYFILHFGFFLLLFRLCFILTECSQYS